MCESNDHKYRDWPTPSSVIASPLSFNVGIELGQLIIIAIALPLLLLLRKSRHNDLGIKILGTVIGIIGLAWAIERIFGYSIGWGPF